MVMLLDQEVVGVVQEAVLLDQEIVGVVLEVVLLDQEVVGVVRSRGRGGGRCRLDGSWLGPVHPARVGATSRRARPAASALAMCARPHGRRHHERARLRAQRDHQDPEEKEFSHADGSTVRKRPCVCAFVATGR